MFHSFKIVFWLSAVMSVFFFVPFDVNGYSTDVWTRLARIREWAAAGFPMAETLMKSQNWPVGFEMHWTRLLDLIGYAAAWPFIPSFGLKKALETMSYFVPLLVFLIGLRGFFYAMRGYVTPKIAFLSFWLFFYGIGYVWGQANVGYFDHHIFHFALLMWTTALTMRFLRTEKSLSLMAWAGFLTAMGTWLTPEYCSVLVFMAVPFVWNFLFKNASLKPAAVYAGVFAVTVGGILLLDRPVSLEAWSDMYNRIAPFHAAVGFFLALAFAGLDLFFKKVKSSFLRRLIWGAAFAVTAFVSLFLLFMNQILSPMADPFLFHLWISKVSEMKSVFEWPWLVGTSVVFPALAAGFALVLAFLKPCRPKAAVLFFLGLGVMSHALIVVWHMRGSIALFSYFLMLMPLVMAWFFSPRERSFKGSVLFVVLYLIFIGSHLKGQVVFNKIATHGVIKMQEDYFAGEAVPTLLKKSFEVSHVTPDNPEALFKYKKEDESFKCQGVEAGFRLLREDPKTGSVLADIFQSPEVLWESERPVWGGPYHGMKQTHRDYVRTILDRPPFATAHALLDKYQTRFLYLVHPRCLHYIMLKDGHVNEAFNESFYVSAYYETALISKRLKRVFYDEKAGIKIFEILPEAEAADTGPVSQQSDF